MAELTPIQGELQARIMTALWKIEQGTVEEVRQQLPPRQRGAYNTVQTVLNRLAERGLLARERRKNAFVYRPRLTEAQYLSQTIERTLSSASPNARQVALAQLIDGLGDGEFSELRQLARRISDERKGRS